jgi:hypothetical protein
MVLKSLPTVHNCELWKIIQAIKMWSMVFNFSESIQIHSQKFSVVDHVSFPPPDSILAFHGDSTGHTPETEGQADL